MELENGAEDWGIGVVNEGSEEIEAEEPEPRRSEGLVSDAILLPVSLQNVNALNQTRRHWPPVMHVFPALVNAASLRKKKIQDTIGSENS